MNNIVAPLESDALIHGRYRIVRPIGRGGMGAVYEATDTRLGHAVALKQTLLQGEEHSAAFAREARVLAALRHPALPVVSDYFSDEGGQFLVMQYIPGDDLATLLHERGRPFSWEEVRPWAEQLIAALEYLHTQDPPIIHRDIKPQNLKLTPRGEIVLLDFGLAKWAAGSVTVASVYGYTPQYASLEQIRAAGTDARSDLYSLAATLYALLTNTAPVNALDRGAALLTGQADPLRPAGDLAPELPPAVNDLLMRCLAINAADRPQSAAELRNALADMANDRFSSAGAATIALQRPQAAPLPSAPPPLPSIPARRGGVAVVLIGALVLMGVLVFAVSWLVLNVLPTALPTAVVVVPSPVPAATVAPRPPVVEIDIPELPDVAATVGAVQTEIAGVGVEIDLPAATGDAGIATLELEFGEEGIAPGLLSDPREVAVGPDGAIYVADFEQGRVQRFDAEGAFDRSWQIPDLKNMLTMTVDRNSRVYVADATNVYVIDGVSGAILPSLKVGDLGGMTDLMVTGEGELFGLPWARDDLLRLNPDGSLVEQISEPLADTDAEGSPLAVTRDGLGRIYVLSDNGAAVYIFGPEGDFRDRFAVEDGWAFSPITVDGRGHIFVGGFMRGVHVFDEAGRLLGSIKVPGVVADVTLDDAGRLYVVTNQARVLRFVIETPQ